MCFVSETQDKDKQQKNNSTVPNPNTQQEEIVQV